MSTKKTKTNQNAVITPYRLRMLTTTAMLGAFAGVLMLIEFPLTFIAPNFYKLDFSEIPVMFGAFAFGPIQGVVIELIKILIHLIFKGTSTGGVGELANFIVGCALVVPAGVIYKIKKTKKAAIIGMAASTVFMGIVSVFLNAFLLLPTFASIFHTSVDTFVAMGHDIFPVVENVFTFCIFCVLPFNLIKGVLVSVVVAIIYKPLARIIHKGRP